jgi:hypothetical protein
LVAIGIAPDDATRIANADQPDLKAAIVSVARKFRELQRALDALGLPRLFGAQLDHLVSRGQQRLGDGQTERLCALKIDGDVNLVGWTTGKSAGFWPLRMRPT